MAEDPESVERLVARIIVEQLGAGGLEKLIQAQQAISQNIQPVGVESQEAFGHPAVTGAVETTLEPAQASFTVSVAPSLSFKAEAVSAIESASPELANEIRVRGAQDATQLINLFMALVQVMQTLLTLYQITHSEPPTQTEIVQIFNQTTNYVLNVGEGPG